MPDTQPAPGLQLKKATPHCGAEVAGIDLSAPLDSETVHALQSALAEHGVLFFRDQTMTPDTTRLSLTVFLSTPHHRMPDYSLTRQEIANVSAYILSLK